MEEGAVVVDVRQCCVMGERPELRREYWLKIFR